MTLTQQTPETMSVPQQGDTTPRRQGPRLETLATHLRCNQKCVYCDRRAETDDPKAIAFATLRTRIETMAQQGVLELRLSGGEPTMRRDLEQLVALALQAGIRAVSLETNATLVDAARAQSLAQAGVKLARVNLAGGDARLDAVTQDPGGQAATVAGMLALLDAGIAVEICVALVRSTLPLLDELPGQLQQALAGRQVQGLEARVPLEAPPGRQGELLTQTEAAAALVRLHTACQLAVLPLRLATGLAPPPCTLPGRGLPHLYALSPGGKQMRGHAQGQPCQTCTVADLCPGFPLQWLQNPQPVQPIQSQRQRRQLMRVHSVEEQIAYELRTTALHPDGEGKLDQEEIIRVQFHCNQACSFCFVSTHLPTAPDAQVIQAIREAGERGSRIVLSGGEPTLHPRLAEFVALARQTSGRPVVLETNATRLDDKERCAQIVRAGVGQAFVSLHGVTPEISDAVTHTPGTFVRTLVGIDNLHAEGTQLILNFVQCAINLGHFEPLVRMAAARWPGAMVAYSFVAPSTDLVPDDPQLIPRYSAAMPELAAGWALARTLGVEIVGLQTMCGVPVCVIPPPFDVETLDMPALPDGASGTEFVKAEVCATCRLNERCYGMRTRYAQLHGMDELKPFL